MEWKFDVCVLGGAGHVGLPLSLVLANKGLKTVICDLNKETMAKISDGIMPFTEEGGQDLLKKVLASGNLTLTSSMADIAKARVLIITIGTPVDEFFNPVFRVMKELIDPLLDHLDNQTIVLRSTVCPGMTDWMARYLKQHNKECKVAFCPERVVQGRGIEEIQSLPQIVAGTTPEAEDTAAELFSLISPEIVRLKPMEAEFAKLFCNAYRYFEFAISNQFFMITADAGVDYSRVREGMAHKYPRMQSVPGAGFTAGPCLFKDTMQLTAFNNNQLMLGMNAVAINEGIPLFITDRIGRKYDLSKLTIGILGLAFKANSDDPRSSLSYKMKKILSFKAHRVLTTDPHVVGDRDNLPLDEVVAKADLFVLCVPHTAYKYLKVDNKPMIDIWNFFGNGVLF